MNFNKQKNSDLSKKINNILKFGSYFLVFILPIFYISNMFATPASPKTFLFYGVVEILTAFWVYALFIDSSYRLNKKTLLYFIPLFCFIIWMTIAGILGVNLHNSFWSSFGKGTGLLTLYHAFAFALIVSSLIKHNGTDYLYKLMHWIINGGFVLALSVWFGSSGFNLLFKNNYDNGGGLMGNSSLAAAYLLFVLVFGIFILTSKNKSGNKWWLGIKIVVILFSPLFINMYGFFTGAGLLGVARGAVLGLIVGVGVTGLFYLVISKNKNYRLLGIIGLIIGVALFCVGWSQLKKPDTFIHQKFVEAASGSRLLFADISQKSMNKHPWFGYGPENFMTAFQNNLNPKLALKEYANEGWNDHAHNIYYDTGVSGGYPAIAFYALFIFSLLYSLYKIRNKEEFNHIQIAILGGLIIGYVFQNLFIFDTQVSLMVLFVLAGIIYTSHDNLSKEKYLLKSTNTFTKDILPIVLVLLCSTSLIIFVWRPVQKAFAYYTVINMPIDIRGSHYSDLLEGSSIGEDWDVSGMAYDIYKYYNSDPVKFKNDSKMLPYSINDIKGLLNYIEIVEHKIKTDTRLDISIVSLYNILNYFENNQYNPTLANHLFKVLDEAINNSPTNQQIYWTMAQVYAWKGDYNGIVDSYKKAVAIEPSVPNSHNMLIRFAKESGNQKLYNESLLQAQKDIPGFEFKE